MKDRGRVECQVLRTSLTCKYIRTCTCPLSFPLSSASLLRSHIACSSLYNFLTLPYISLPHTARFQQTLWQSLFFSLFPLPPSSCIHILFALPFISSLFLTYISMPYMARFQQTLWQSLFFSFSSVSHFLHSHTYYLLFPLYLHSSLHTYQCHTWPGSDRLCGRKSTWRGPATHWRLSGCPPPLFLVSSRAGRPRRN